jgi:hypothetical protein
MKNPFFGNINSPPREYAALSGSIFEGEVRQKHAGCVQQQKSNKQISTVFA